MAIAFDESNDYYVITDAAELTLQDGDWCVGAWTYVSDNAGSDSQYLLSNNGWSANNSFNLVLYEASYATAAYRGKWSFGVEDGDGTYISDLSSSAPGADSTWRLIIVQRNTTDNEIQMYFCEVGAANSKEIGIADTDMDAVNGGNWNIARRVDGDADRYYGGIAAEVFKGNFILTTTQIEALGAGLPIKTLAKKAGLTLDLYLPMWLADATLLDYSNSGNSAARQDAPATSTHPPICTPVKRRRMG